MGTELWTLTQLADRVADALSSGYDGQQSRRVTEVPDLRAIRYYTTLGLIDRPAEMRGRTALYGTRHLWQLVAIKRLQAEGRALADIQHQLAGAPDGTLRRLAAVPDEGFWRRIPSVETSTDDVPAAAKEATTEPTDQALSLGGGIVVIIPHRNTLTADDIAALRTAAGPLNAVLARLTKGTS